jgi:hypothetical protein
MPLQSPGDGLDAFAIFNGVAILQVKNMKLFTNMFNVPSTGQTLSRHIIIDTFLANVTSLEIANVRVHLQAIGIHDRRHQHNTNEYYET